MRILTYILFLCLSLNDIAAQQSSVIDYREGGILMVDGTLKSGLLKYDLKNDVVYLKDSVSNTMETIAAINMESFVLLPMGRKPFRLFRSYPYQNKAGYMRSKIFEVLIDDEISLLGREFITTRTTYMLRQGNNTSRYWDYYLFLVKPSGEVVELRRIKRQVIEALGTNKEELRAFIKDEELRLDKIGDMVKLVKYYNELLKL